MGGKLMAFFILDFRMQILDLREAKSMGRKFRIANCEIKESESRMKNQKGNTSFLLTTEFSVTFPGPPRAENLTPETFNFSIYNLQS